jgi:hypothetical protein
MWEGPQCRDLPPDFRTAPALHISAFQFSAFQLFSVKYIFVTGGVVSSGERTRPRVLVLAPRQNNLPLGFLISAFQFSVFQFFPR